MNPPPGRAIQQLDQDRAALQQRLRAFEVEAIRVEEDWTAILAHGGGAPDQASQLLVSLRPHLGAIASLCQSIDSSIARMADRPFD